MDLRFRIADRANHIPGYGRLLVACERGANHGGSERECAFSLWPHAAEGRMWQWDGNKQAPTISPSIDCHGGCGRHFTMTKGRA